MRYIRPAVLCLSHSTSLSLDKRLAERTDCVIHVCLFRDMAQSVQSINISGMNERHGETVDDVGFKFYSKFDDRNSS